MMRLNKILEDKSQVRLITRDHLTFKKKKINKMQINKIMLKITTKIAKNNSMNLEKMMNLRNYKMKSKSRQKNNKKKPINKKSRRFLIRIHA